MKPAINIADVSRAIMLGMAVIVGSSSSLLAADYIAELRAKAESGDANSEWILGEDYAQGVGVAKDAVAAINWLSKAADHGNMIAANQIGIIYEYAEGVAKDSAQAVIWFRKAAYGGDAYGQNNLGTMYDTGDGVLKDEIEALAWYNISAVSGNSAAIQNREQLELVVGTQAALVAQHRSKEILSEIQAAKDAAKAENQIPASGLGGAPRFTGTGTIVSTAGIVLTAAHVVGDSAKITVLTESGAKPASVVRMDVSNDLALLKIAGAGYPALTVSPSRGVRLGQSVATIGFPNVDIQGFSPKLTRGEISSENGVGDDPRSWQISVPVQPGNSGGPLLDQDGNLIGVVVSKLGIKAAEATGDLPQNVGYAVKSVYALALLEPYLDNFAANAPVAKKRVAFEDMIENAEHSVVLILVY